MSLTNETAGTKVRVVADSGYLNEGATAVLSSDVDPNTVWVQVVWDEPKEGRIDGYYHKQSFVVVEPEKVSLTQAISALVDKTFEEAYNKGKAEAEPDEYAVVITEEDRDELTEGFRELQVLSAKVYDKLTSLGVL